MYFLLVMGKYKIEHWHLFKLEPCSGPNGKNPRVRWRKLI